MYIGTVKKDRARSRDAQWINCSTRHAEYRFSTGKRTNVPDGAAFIFGDLADPATLSLVPDGAYDAVVHLAAQAGVRHSLKEPHDSADGIPA